MGGFVEELTALIAICPNEKYPELVAFTRAYLLGQAARMQGGEDFARVLQAVDTTFMQLETAGIANLGPVAAGVRNSAILKTLNSPLILSLEEFHQFNQDITNLENVHKYPLLTHALVCTVQKLLEPKLPIHQHRSALQYLL